ncbi:MAG: acyl-CoA dehydrogenase family protein [Desulfomonilia bacterium]|jgi:alkylation response protein AidB-like acyl-CoA dehydrogenase|uniref:Putative acyl-CoA dehydrogenase YngJ n=1 Tax=anaerobic digester metagenome TaxID=1263854 RepID=A0A485M553_9ZZZZ|nr:acyl-CoA dehydrogenase family protein [Pseudomonadota bacterium]HPD20130.1 acyl-CoA dehydrogenase family protein [Deltaproteobacteria bacterium]HPX17916.1 acyl-CoA dehydrogenase family protein [Deltaproteobacteria bacterium]HRS54898.1 acyl-CoA dehydrogenase family protein [Desulfomonilia bacterium]HRV34347.1 acyl-CoA dehydrogenase family protein [Desulfomonilia bacterium]
MFFELSAEQQALRQKVIDFCARECPPDFETSLDQSGAFPGDLYRKMADYGLLGISFPAEYGGTGGDIMDIVLIAEQLAGNSFTAVYMYLVNVVFAGSIILNCGSDAQKKEYLPKLLKGELQFSFALTEPEAGSDARSIKTSAKLQGDRFLINGTKYWTSGATVSDYIITVTITGPQTDSSKAMSIFIVPAGSQGLSITPIPKLAGNAYPSCEVKYRDVSVGREHILGGPEWLNNGLLQLFRTAEYERICVAASCLGGAETILRECTAFAKNRQQFGKPIIKFQAIQHALADMATQIEAMRWMTYHAAWMKSAGKDCFKEICMAKLFCSETLNDIARKGMQIFGGRGYSMEYRMQRYLRESYLSLYAGGTSEIQKNVIARFL